MIRCMHSSQSNSSSRPPESLIESLAAPNFMAIQLMRLSSISLGQPPSDPVGSGMSMELADRRNIHRANPDRSKEISIYLSMALFSSISTSKKLLQYLSHRMFAARVWSIKCRRKEKLIAQFGGKLRDERFEPN